MAREFWWVDAFAGETLRGNPCAVVLDAEGLSDERMLALAREMNLSETAFVSRAESGGFRARYFTPEREIPLAGHPTIAAAHALAESGRFALEGIDDVLRLELTAGPVTVEIRADEAGVRWYHMRQPPPRFLRSYEPEEVLPLFGLEAEELVPFAPIQTVSTGTPMLMIPLQTHAALERARMDVHGYRRLRESGDFFSPHLFCRQGATAAGQTFARHFGVPPDTLEDPFTGSATGCMASYLWRHGLIKEPTFAAEQGHWMGRPGLARVEVLGPPNAITGVKVGGQAATLVRGAIEL